MQRFVVSQEETFSTIVALSSTPKMKFGSDEQDTTSEGLPKWEVQVVGGFTDPFGRSQNEILKITVAAKADPLASVGQLTPVKLRGFEVGVMDKRDRQGNVTGAQVYYRAEAIEPATPAATSSRSKSSEAA